MAGAHALLFAVGILCGAVGMLGVGYGTLLAVRAARRRGWL